MNINEAQGSNRHTYCRGSVGKLSTTYDVMTNTYPCALATLVAFASVKSEFSTIFNSNYDWTANFSVTSKHSHNIHGLNTVKMLLLSLHYGEHAKCTNRTMEFAYADPQCTAGMQSISDTDAATTLAECHLNSTVMEASLEMSKGQNIQSWHCLAAQSCFL